MATNNSDNFATAATGTVLQGAGIGSAPIFSTATYPLTTTISQVLYSSATNVVSGLATANNGVHVTNNTGVPSVLAGPGTTGQILQANAAAAPSFSTAAYPSTTTINQILFSSAANTITGLATANAGVLATSSSGVPAIDTTNFAVLSTGLQLKGNNTNTPAPAGFIGQVLTASVATPGSSISNDTLTQITTLSVTAGNWMIFGLVSFIPSLVSGHSLVGVNTSAAFTNFGLDYLQDGTVKNSAEAFATASPIQFISLSGTTTYYLMAQIHLTTGTATAFGKIQAVRIG